MTPYELEILLHYYVSPAPFARITAPAFLGAVGGLIGDDLLQLDEGGYHVTDKGLAFVRMVLATPLPEQEWTDPRTGGVIS
jgi:hypothetical protein